MNRKILFRGKKVDNGEWVYGYYIAVFSHSIVGNNGVAFEVDLKTIGQYTGLTDKNGKKIFEGDILKVPAFLYGEEKICVCIYNQENSADAIIGFGLYMNNGYFSKYQDLVESDEWDEFEVIGNIFDKEVE